MKRILVATLAVLMMVFLSGNFLFASGDKVNINTATEEELCTLNGIGPAYAKAIVEYRTANGPFGAPERIKDVKGIGEKIFEKIKDRLVVKDEAKE